MISPGGGSRAPLGPRLRRATEAALANLMAADQNRKVVMTTLVGDVAANYFTLRELDYELEISQRTLGTRRESLRLIQTRQDGGRRHLANQKDFDSTRFRHSDNSE